MKNNNTFMDALKLAKSQKSHLLKVKYLGLALIFTPFLLSENKNTNKRSTGGESLAGDDIYPLF